MPQVPSVGIDVGWAATVVVTADVLLAEFRSVVLVPTVALLLMVDPTATEFATLATSVNVTDADAAIVVAEHETPPAAPTPGCVQVNVGAPDCASERKVSPAGNTSVRVTLLADEGPLLVTTML
jgi:hypothetical protein